MMKQLGNEYKIKNLGEISLYLGISVKRTNERLFFDEKNKIEEF